MATENGRRPQEGRCAVVTGVGSGLGQAIARELAAEGALVVGCDVNDSAGEATMDGIGTYLHADVSRESEVEGLIAAAVERHGRLDVMVNNAAVQIEQELAETTEEQLDRILAVNLKGVFFGCKYGIPALRRSGGGSIVNTASFVALMGAATAQIAYTASKGGVLAMTREIAVAHAKQGIRANALCPGPVNTPLLAQLLAEPAARARRLVHVPMGRLAEAGEIARAALFLASDDSSYITGATLVVDGGITAAYVTPE